ncbi:MAG: hypothetical protein J7K48_09275 [Thermococcus sp.]|nr:hypothetical protein [Thermococcus sp.]
MRLFKKKMEPAVVKEAEKWIRKLREMGPREIIDKALEIRRVEYVRGEGETYFELVLHDSRMTRVEVSTQGMMYVEHRGQYVLFSLDVGKTKDVAEKLKKVGWHLKG